MTTEVKLLTEAEARALYSRSENGLVEELRERGLIAPEPDAIDRLRDALEAIHGITLDRDKMARVCRKARMELRPPLTREALGDAIVKVFNEGAKGFGGVTPDNITRLHAALTDAKGGE